MPFRNKKKIASLQAYSKKSPKKQTNTHKKNRIKTERVSLSPAFMRYKSIVRQGVKASLSVEAAVVLPLFMFAVILIMYVCRIINFSDIVLESMHQCGKEMALKAYLTKGADTGEAAGRLGGVLLSESYVKSQVEKNLAENGFKEESISFLYSKILDDDIVDLVALEDIQLPYNIFGIKDLKIVDRVYIHAFTGYDNTRAQNVTDDDDQIVYITENGSVYHSSRSCSHLKIDIKMIAKGAVESCRNNGGGKYYECEYCSRCSDTGAYYITDYGDRYHRSVNCPGLKRDIRAVKKSEVSGRRACKDCT